MPKVTSARHGYDIVEVFPQTPGSRFVAHVRDDAGRDLILKAARTDHEAFRHEAATLRAWERTGAAARLVAEPEPDVIVLKRVPGSVLKDLPDGGVSRAREVGALARRLHIPAPEGARPLTEHMQHDWDTLVRDHELLHPELKRIANTCRHRLGTYSGPNVLLHGDLWATNIIARPDGELIAIDPYGISGPAAFDLAYFPAVAHAPDRWQTLRAIVGGYGEQPPLLAEAFAWVCIVNLAYLIRREKPLEELQLLVADLLYTGEPADWLPRLS